MPRFHLHLHNSHGLSRDEDGQELPDLAHAKRSAIDGIRSVLSEEVLVQGIVDLQGRIEIADGAGVVLCTIAFRDAIEIRGAET